jgi:hypothetical protein
VRNVSLAQLRADAQLFANQVTTALVSPAQLDRLINLRLARLYDLLIEAGGHEYYEQNVVLTTSPGSALIALPQDFYELLYIAARWSADSIEEIPALDHLADQIDYRILNSWAEAMPKCFRLQRSLIEFFPTPSASTTIELRYIPICPTLVDPLQSFDGVDGWEVLVSAGAAIDLCGLQALPTAYPAGLYAETMDRIEGLSRRRAAAHPPSIRDVHGRGGPGQWWRRLPRPV